MKNEFEIRGDVTAIFLKRKDGSIIETLIDTEDLSKVQEFPNTWFAWFSERTKSYYVFGKVWKGSERYQRIWLHRVIMDTPTDLDVDHFNHQTLDNTKCNLRNVSKAQNKQNLSGPRRDNKAGIRGVNFDKQTGKWRAQAQVKGVKYHLGLHDDIEKAKEVVIAWRKEHMPYSNEEVKSNVL